MYTYPNGLVCDASQRRVQWYERLAPPLFLLLILVGCFAIPMTITTTWAVFTLLLAFVGIVAWSAFCTVLAFILFQYWCKPRT